MSDTWTPPSPVPPSQGRPSQGQPAQGQPAQRPPAQRPASPNGSTTEMPTGPLDDAEDAVRRLENCVDLLAKGMAGIDRAQTLVLAGRASALLGVVDTTADDPEVRRRAAGLRSRYDTALLRLGGLGVAEPRTRRRPGLVIDLSTAPDGLGFRQLAHSVTNALMVMGALLLAFAVYSVGFGHLTYDRHQRLMLDQFSRDVQQAAAIAAASVAGDRDLGAAPPRGKPSALLEIPKIGLREVMVQGTGTRELRSAVGHYRPSPMPGQLGNAVLAGHRNLYGRPFARLGELRPGDPINVITQEGRFTYTVEVTQTATTGQQDFLSQETFVNRLTLLTTTGSGKGGRFAVISRLQSAPAALRIRDDRELQSDELGLGRDSGGWWPSIGWGAGMLAALAVTSVLYRRWRRTSTYLITTPVLLVVALLWFESVARLVPSTF